MNESADRPVLALVGTGGLARAICYSLAGNPHPARVLVIGRDAAKAAAIAYVAATRAAVAGVRTTFQPLTADLADPGSLARHRPRGVLLAASTQSPWEGLAAPSAWTALLKRAGFGLTLPFQADSALRVGAAAAEAGAWFVNACFPDAVNPLLAARGVPVLCGIGNAGLLAASLQAALGLPDQGALRVLAHHVHLYTPEGPQDEALAWCDGRPVAGVGDLLAAQRATPRTELNHVTGHTAARVLDALLRGTDLDTSLPGPLGLPGGYPVRLTGGRVETRLPPELSRAEAVAFNQRAALRDGVAVDGDHVVFGPAARTELDPLAPDLAAGFPVSDLEQVTWHLDLLRARLRDRAHPDDQTTPIPVSPL
ncbi:hypothetical protein [Nonomuraea sp. NPDC046570]|uniref:hypothetical protein n=1 Tax=Nonomuraea sp. NPDC046570 TaxID=3155255 RepID=UPI0033EE88B8